MRYGLVIVGSLASAACATLPTRVVVPEMLLSEASLPGLEGTRVWGDAPAADIERFLQADQAAIREKYRRKVATGEGYESHILALSGGADDGAFGAGLLVGWGEAGTRPDFDLVTGISAGALIAPLIFVGKEYDDELASVFTTHTSSEIYTANVLAGILGGAAVADSGPLGKLIERYVTASLVQRVAEERAKGRLLIIGTTNLDAQRPVFWDMGKIASRGGARSLEIFRKVLLASASIPGVFPPVHFAVKAAGQTYDELHVDGGATRAVFLSPSGFSFKSVDRIVGRRIKRQLFVIRNGKMGPEYAASRETTLGIAQRSLETLTKNQGIGDLVRMYARAKSDGIDYNLIAVPDSFKAERPEPFDAGYMRSLYAEGYRTGKDGVAWLKTPPGFASASSD
ncbi:MAG: patatin-like phospholipase family protein [Hyphomicrobium sp.]